MKFVKKHKLLILVLVLIVAFVSFNIIRQRNVRQVAQDDTPSPQQVEQTITQIEPQPQQNTPVAPNPVLRQGTFVNGAKAYKGQGTARVLVVDGKPVVQLSDDFKTTSGPDLHVYISKNPDPKSQGLGDHLSLGGLKSNDGAQIYNLPADQQSYASVFVWCRAFTSVFTQATF